MRKKPISAQERAGRTVWGDCYSFSMSYEQGMLLERTVTKAILAHQRAANRLRQRRAKKCKELAPAYVPEFGPCYFCKKPVKDAAKHYDVNGNCKSRKWWDS